MYGTSELWQTHPQWQKEGKLYKYINTIHYVPAHIWHGYIIIRTVGSHCFGCKCVFRARPRRPQKYLSHNDVAVLFTGLSGKTSETAKISVIMTSLYCLRAFRATPGRPQKYLSHNDVAVLFTGLSGNTWETTKISQS